MSRLIVKGSSPSQTHSLISLDFTRHLARACNLPVTFPLTDEMDQCYSDIQEAVRNAKGYWYGKGLAASANQVGYHYRMFAVASLQNMTKATHVERYRTFQLFANPKILALSEARNTLKLVKNTALGRVFELP